MAGEVFIARQDTLETVKGTVDGIDSGVKQTNNALGNFSGGGTDTVKTELETLKNNMAQLQTKVDQLLSKGSGELKLKKLISSYNDIPLNKDITLIVVPYASLKNPFTDAYGILLAKGKIKINGLVMKNVGTYEDFSFPIGFKFKLNVSDGEVTAAIKDLTIGSCYIFECE